MIVARHRGDRATIEGVTAVVTGRPLNDHGCRWFGGERGVHGFYLRRFGIGGDRHGFTIIAGEWHLAKHWGSPAVVYWGDIAPAELVDTAGGLDAFLASWTR